MPRRPDERFAVTVTLTEAERDCLEALRQAINADSMMDTARTAFAALADTHGIVTTGLFVRMPWGDQGWERRRRSSVNANRPKKPRRRPSTVQPDDHPWRRTLYPEAE